MAKWESMDTAPRDGSTIRIFVPMEAPDGEAVVTIGEYVPEEERSVRWPEPDGGEGSGGWLLAGEGSGRWISEQDHQILKVMKWAPFGAA